MAEKRPPVTGQITEFGFDWGRVKVQRSWTHKGYLGISVYTGRKMVHITITPSGLIRIGEVEKDWHK